MGLSIPRDECHRCRLWKISSYSKMAFANSTLVFHRRRLSSSTCIRAQNDAIWPLESHRCPAVAAARPISHGNAPPR